MRRLPFGLILSFFPLILLGLLSCGGSDRHLPTYTVTFSASSGGSISGESVQRIEAGGTSSVVRAIPLDGYHFTEWTGDSHSTATDLIIENIQTDLTITATFARNSYTVVFLAGNHGVVEGDLVQTVPHGQSTSAVQGIAEICYRFKQWQGDYSGVEPALTIASVTRDMKISAEFELDASSYTVTFQAGPHGRIEGSATQTIGACQPSQLVSAIPDPNYEFTGWSGDLNSTDANLTVPQVTRNMSLIANFELKTYTVSFIAGNYGSISGETTQRIKHGQNTTAVTAVATDRAHFVNWSGDYPADTPEIVIANVIGDMSVTANFIRDKYTVKFLAGSFGHIEGAAVQQVFAGDSSEKVRAQPDPTYKFTGWSGSLVSTERELIVQNVLEPLEITASFAKEMSFNLAVDRVVINQASQFELKSGNPSPPLVAGRGAMIRVFLNVTNGPDNLKGLNVTLHGLRNGEELEPLSQAFDIPSVPNENTDNNITFNLPENWSVPGLAIAIEVDSGDNLPETDETDNRFPISGWRSLAFEEIDPQEIVLVPIRYEYDGYSHTPSTGADVIAMFRKSYEDLYPKSSIHVTVHPEIGWDKKVSASGNGWNGLLSAVAEVRRGEDYDPRSYHYGLFNYGYTGDTSTVAGLGYVNTPSQSQNFAAIGLDSIWFMSETAAHETGHNHGRLHAPCGDPDGVDPSYPYSGGIIGVPGYDLIEHSTIPKTRNFDLMSYCSPSWISDYTYKGIFTFDAEVKKYYSQGVPALMGVWISGEISGTGHYRLRSMQQSFVSNPPPDQGDHVLEFWQEDQLIHHSHFQPSPIDHLTGQAAFALLAPAGLGYDRLSIRVAGNLVWEQKRPAGGIVWPDQPIGRTHQRLSLPAVTLPGGSRIIRKSDDGRHFQVIRVDWDAGPALVLTPPLPRFLEIQLFQGVDLLVKRYEW